MEIINRMISYLKDISAYIVIAIIINFISILFGTDYLINYLKSNLITIQLTLMAINTATSGLVVSKLQEIKSIDNSVNIKPTIKALLSSLREQLILICFGLLILLIIDSKILLSYKGAEYYKFIIDTLLIFVFVNSIQILWDTGKSIFVITNISD